MSSWWEVGLGALAALLVLWVVLVALLWLSRPDDVRLRDAVRVLPDLVRLLARLATDRSLPRGVRVRLWLLGAYLAMPIDLVPDVVPVLGHLDDVLVVVLVLRSVARRAGPQALRRHWPGTPAGLATVERLAGVSPAGGGRR